MQIFRKLKGLCFVVQPFCYLYEKLLLGARSPRHEKGVVLREFRPFGRRSPHLAIVSQADAALGARYELAAASPRFAAEPIRSTGHQSTKKAPLLRCLCVIHENLFLWSKITEARKKCCFTRISPIRAKIDAPVGCLIRTRRCRSASASIRRTDRQNKKHSNRSAFCFGDPYENRTRVTAVKGRCLNLLTNGPLANETLSGLVLVAEIGLEPMTYRV